MVKGGGTVAVSLHREDWMPLGRALLDAFYAGTVDVAPLVRLFEAMERAGMDVDEFARVGGAGHEHCV